MMYVNEGTIVGKLTKEPIRVSKGVLSFQLEVRKPLNNGRTRLIYPSFVVYRERIDEFTDKEFEIGDVIKIDYELETKRKIKETGKEYHDNKIVLTAEKVE